MRLSFGKRAWLQRLHPLTLLSSRLQLCSICSGMDVSSPRKQESRSSRTHNQSHDMHYKSVGQTMCSGSSSQDTSKRPPFACFSQVKRCVCRRYISGPSFGGPHATREKFSRGSLYGNATLVAHVFSMADGALQSTLYAAMNGHVW